MTGQNVNTAVLVTGLLRGIFRTLSNICDGNFFAIEVNDQKPFSIFAQNRPCHERHVITRYYADVRAI